MIPERTVKKQWRQLKIMWIYVKTSLATKKYKVKIWNFGKVLENLHYGLDIDIQQDNKYIWLHH